MSQLLGLLIIVIIALALTSTVSTAAIDAAYAPFTENKVIVPSTSNSTTALTHPARNDSATYAWFTITTDNATNYGLYVIDCANNITYTVATKIIAFDVGVFNASLIYTCTINYYWLSLGAAEQTLLSLVPLFWVTLILAAVVVVVIYKLKFKQ